MSFKNKKVVWTDDQDKLLSKMVEKNGPKQWSKMADELYQLSRYRRKTGRQCRERWYNQLNPTIMKKKWTLQEEDILFEQHQKHGSKWSIIAQKLVGRCQNAIKNHFYSIARKSLRRIVKFMGSKEGTAQVRKIKPSTLSKIFTLTECKRRVYPNQETEPSCLDCQQQRYKEMAYHFINFSRLKLSDKKSKIASEDLQKFQTILKQLEKIKQKFVYPSEIYEIKRTLQTKIRKQKKLQKKFDEVVQSDSEYESESQLKKKILRINLNSLSNLHFQQSAFKNEINEKNKKNREDMTKKGNIFINSKKEKVKQLQKNQQFMINQLLIAEDLSSSKIQNQPNLQLSLKESNLTTDDQQNIFNFNVIIQLDNVPEIDNRHPQTWMTMSPSFGSFFKKMEPFSDIDQNHHLKCIQSDKTQEEIRENEEEDYF